MWGTGHLCGLTSLSVVDGATQSDHVDRHGKSSCQGGGFALPSPPRIVRMAGCCPLARLYLPKAYPKRCLLHVSSSSAPKTGSKLASLSILHLHVQAIV